MIFTAMKTGFAQAWASKRMILLYYLTNLVFGTILMLPFRSVLHDFVGNSLMGEKLAGRLDMDFLFEFIKENPNLLSSYLILLPLLLVGYWLIMLFFSGGAFSLFIRGEKFSAAQFWGDAAKYFGRFLRLVLWSIPLGIALFCLQFIWSGFQRVMFGSDPYQSVIYWGGWIKVGLRYISFILFLMILDYARIYAVRSDEKRMRVSLLQGLKFAASNLKVTFGFALLFFLIGIISLIIYNTIADLLHSPNSAIILLLFIWQQIYVALRMILKLALYAGEAMLYQLISN